VISQSFRGVMKGQTLVELDSAVPLPDGTPVEVTPLRPKTGSPQAVLAAMEAEPKLTAEDVAELERAIARVPRAACLACLPVRIR